MGHSPPPLKIKWNDNEKEQLCFVGVSMKTIKNSQTFGDGCVVVFCFVLYYRPFYILL